MLTPSSISDLEMDIRNSRALLFFMSPYLKGFYNLSPETRNSAFIIFESSESGDSGSPGSPQPPGPQGP